MASHGKAREDAGVGSEGGNAARGLLVELHRKYVVSLQEKKDTFEYAVTEHLRMSGIYWGLCSMDLLSDIKSMDCEGIAKWVMECQHDSGGFGGGIGHDAHMLYTLSAVQILALLDRMDLIDGDKIAGYVSKLQQPDGSFAGGEWGEIDTRFSYCALSCLSLISRLYRIDVPKAVDFVLSCMNFDGGFGCVPGAESHSGQVFTCVGALAIAGALERVSSDKLGWWLCERQVAGGGLNGRPEKLPDVCYSWWVLSSLAMVARLDWIDRGQLKNFILNAQDEIDGGIADRPGDVADVFHTFFGICGLSLLGYTEDDEGGYQGLRRVDPVYALPVDTLKRMGMPIWRE